MRATPPASIVASSVGEIEPRAVGCVRAEMGVHVDEAVAVRHERPHVRAPDALERGGGFGEGGGHGAGC